MANTATRTAPAPTPSSSARAPIDEKERFVAELEFVQCLAAPSYIHCELKCAFTTLSWQTSCRVYSLYFLCSLLIVLAQRRYFDNPAFVNFLVYLRYFKRPEYAVYVR